MVRLKHRFIVAQAVPGPNSKLQGSLTLTSRETQSILRNKIQELYGDVGLGEFGQATYVRYLEGKFSNIFVVKTTRDAQIKVHFALSCISELTGVQLCIRTLSIHSCQRTCMQALTGLFETYFDRCCDGMPSSELALARETIKKNLAGLEM